MDYGLALGRRFRALKLWFVLRAYGAEGLAEIIGGHVELARELAGWVDAEPGWERLAPVPFSTVCFRRHPEGVDDEAELRAAQRPSWSSGSTRSGEAFVSHTRVAGRYAIRIAIGNMGTQRGTWRGRGSCCARRRPPRRLPSRSRSASGCREARADGRCRPASRSRAITWMAPPPGSPPARPARPERSADKHRDQDQERAELDRAPVHQRLQDVVFDLLVDDVDHDHDDAGGHARVAKATPMAARAPIVAPTSGTRSNTPIEHRQGGA